jgi:hypothetical protein
MVIINAASDVVALDVALTILRLFDMAVSLASGGVQLDVWGLEA